jgi:hypothetical protein
MQAHKLWIGLWAALSFRKFLQSRSYLPIPPVSLELPFPGLFPDTLLCWHQAAEFQLQLCPVTLNKALEPSQFLFSWTHLSPSVIKDM